MDKIDLEKEELRHKEARDAALFFGTQVPTFAEFIAKLREAGAPERWIDAIEAASVSGAGLEKRHLFDALKAQSEADLVILRLFRHSNVLSNVPGSETAMTTIGSAFSANALAAHHMLTSLLEAVGPSESYS